MSTQATNTASGEQSNDGVQEQDKTGGSSTRSEYEQLPDDHPLVKRLEAQKLEIKELKPKAKLVDDANEAKKTDAEKIAGLQAQIDGLPKAVAGALREHLVALHEFDTADADLFLTGDTPELLLKQAARLLEQSGSGAKRKFVSKEGTQQRKPAESENSVFAKSLFGGSDD